MSETFDKFTLRQIFDDEGGARYAASHELHNEVSIDLPHGYFGEMPWPAYILVPNFRVLGPGEIGTCEGCGETEPLMEGEVVPTGASNTTQRNPRKTKMCTYCWEVADGADPITGSYGAASAEWIRAERVGGIQK